MPPPVSRVGPRREEPSVVLRDVRRYAGRCGEGTVEATVTTAPPHLKPWCSLPNKNAC